MAEFAAATERVSAFPYGLYQSEVLAPVHPPQERDGFYLSMLKDDLRQLHFAYEPALVPQGIGWRQASERIFALLNDFHRGGYFSDPAELVCDFAHELLEESVDGEELLLELHALPDEDYGSTDRVRRRPALSSPGGTLPSLGLVPRWSVTESRSGVVQVATLSSRQPVVIPGSRIQRVGLREANKRKWTRTVKELRQIDAVKLLGSDLDRLTWRGYAFSHHLATQNLALAAATAPLGWDARGAFSESVTSPYLAYRRLRFVRFWVETIEDSLAFLNQFTGSESLYGDAAFTFTLTGLPSPNELTEAMGEIRSGSLTVGDAHGTYFNPKYAKRRGESPDGA